MSRPFCNRYVVALQRSLRYMRKSAFPGTTYLTAVQFSPNRSLDRTIELISDWAIDRIPSITRILIDLSKSAEAQLRTKESAQAQLRTKESAQAQLRTF